MDARRESTPAASARLRAARADRHRQQLHRDHYVFLLFSYFQSFRVRYTSARPHSAGASRGRLGSRSAQFKFSIKANPMPMKINYLVLIGN